MKRHLFNLVTALSLALCLACATLWAHGYQRQGWVKWTHGGSRRTYALLLGNYPGRLSIAISWQAADAPPQQWYGFILPPMSAEPRFRSWSGDTPPSTDTYDPYAMTLPDRPDLHQFAGLAWYADHSYASGWALLIPHRYVVLAAAVLPLRWIWLRCRATRRSRRRACVVCGYDLRATPQRCPECGTVPATPPASSHRHQPYPPRLPPS